MDQLTVILAILSAIVFTWVGYFLGNIFPFQGKKQSTNPVEKSGIEDKFQIPFIQKLMELFSGEKEETEEPDEIPSRVQDSTSVEGKIPLRILKEYTHVWYDRSERKLFAELNGEGIDLDSRLTPDQHSLLSFFLLDLQDKVGISAALRSVIEEREGDAFPKKDEEEVSRQRFNPVKSFLNYVQSDVPKLEEKEDSIPVQINEILKKKLKGTSLENQGISIGEWPDRGVVFIVGVDVYSDIHEIPNPNIRQVIREAVKEWESRENSE